MWRAAALAPLLVLPLLLVGAACSSDGDEAPSTDEVDPQQVLEAAAARMEQLESFRFTLDFTGGNPEIIRGLRMEEAAGDFGGTDHFQASLGASLGPLNLDVEVRVVDGVSWITNPLTGRWEREEFSIESFFDLSAGVTALMRSARNPAVEGIERIDGASSYRVEASLPSDELQLIPGVRGGETVAATAWIGRDDSLVRRLELVGSLFAPGEEVTVRLDLRDFDEPVTIESPR